MKGKAPGRYDRKGLSFIQLFEKFPDEQSARKWLEEQRWKDGRYCPRCGSMETSHKKHEKPMPYWCRTCEEHFSVRTGTVMECSRIPLRKWVFALYLMSTSLKGVSSMKLHRDLGISQKAAWFMPQRIREGWDYVHSTLEGEVEVDETFIGGKEANKHAHKKIRRGRGAVGKEIVAGMKERDTGQIIVEHVDGTSRDILQGFIEDYVEDGSTVYTDESSSYKGMEVYRHRFVKHSIGEYVNGMAHTNGIESFWSMLKRGYHGTYHHLSPKHLQRYIQEFAGRHNVRDLDTIQQMEVLALALEGKRLTYQQLIE